jgi:uncharacterized protein YkwD
MGAHNVLDLARLRTPRSTASLAALLVGVVALASACLPYNSQEQYLFNKTNELRRDQGVNALGGMDQLTARARTLAGGLAARRTLAHSDLHQLGVAWTAAAENVGRSSSIEDVYARLADSPSHRANMVNPAYTRTGVGTARGKDGSVYVVQLFWRG